MADDVQKLGLDASQLIAELAKVQASFTSQAKSVDDAVNSYVKLTKTTKGVKGEFSLINDEGLRLEGTLKRVKGQWDAQVKSISQTEESLKRMKQAQADANSEAAKVKAQSLIQANTQINAQAVPDRAVSALRSAQAKLTDALTGDLANGDKIATEMFDKLKRGVVDVETGVRGKIQGAVATLLNLQQRITKEIDKQNAASGPTPSARNAASQQAAAAAAQAFISSQAGVTGAIPPNLLSGLSAAQSKLAKALGDDLAKSGPIADEIFNKLKRGTVETETGIRDRIQKALISVLNISERISKEQAKIASPAAPANTIKPEQLSGLKQNLVTQFPVPSNASLSSVVTFQRALDNLIAQAAKGKLTFQELVDVINKVKADPKAINDFGVDGDKVAGNVQKVITAFDGVKKSAKDVETQGKNTGNTLFLSFDQFVKLLEIQVVHRAFGSLITAMQGSIAKAAELQVRISEIRTVSQNAGVGFEELQNKVRTLSDSFGKSQLDVAEAAYQGFSNQVLKTSADLNALNDVLRLAQITNSSVAASMEAFSSVVNAYRLGVFEASAVTAELFKAVELGRFRLDDIANSLGRVTVVASQLNVTNAEVSGLLAQLTVNGVSADEAMTQISSIMQALLKPSDAMKKIFRELGVENGQAAIQTFGFVNVLQKLFSTAQSGNADIAALFPNVRALRGVLGATAGGGTGELQSTIDQIRNAGASADAAVGIIAESAGQRLRKEFNKITNFFISDFGNGAINAIERISAPFGGLAEVVKGFGRAIIDTFSALDRFATILANVATLGQGTGVNLEVLTKAYISYKAAVVGLQAAQAASAAVASFEAAQRLKSSEITLFASTQENIFTIAKVRAAVAAAANIASEAAWSVARVAYNTVTTIAIVVNDIWTASTFRGAAASVAATLGLGSYSIGMIATTVATTAATIATRILTVALAALPFVALAVAIGLAVGAFDGLIEKWTVAGQRAIALREQTALLQRQLEQQRDQENRAATADARGFREDLTARTSAASRVLAELRRQSTGLIDAQKDAVKQTEEQVKESLDRVSRSMSESISELSSKINKFKSNIEASLKFEATFKDRESSRGFQAALDAAGQRADVQTGLQPLNQRDQEIEDFKRRDRQKVFGEQNTLIQDRINQLQREARTLTRQGDQESIESARRKFEEIRRLIEQQEALGRAERRSQAQDVATDTARRTGQFVTASFDNGLARLRERLRAIQEEEARAEQLFRSQQAARQQAAEAERRRQQEAQQRFIDANKDLQKLQREAVNPDGTVAERFRDRQGEARGAGLQRFREEFDRIQERLQQAGTAAGADPILVVQAVQQLGSQRIAIEQQIQRQITDNAIAELQRELQEKARLIQEAATEQQRRASEARNARTTLLGVLPGQLGDIDRTAGNLATQVNQRQGNETEAQMRARIQLFTEAQQRFTEARAGVEQLIQAAADARSPEEQIRTLRALQERVQSLNEAFRTMAAQGAGANRIITQGRSVLGIPITSQTEDFTGNDVGAGAATTTLSQNSTTLATAAANLEAATNELNRLRAESTQLETNLLALSPELRLVAAGLDGAARNAQAAIEPFANFTTAVNNLNASINALRNQPPLVIPQLPVAPNGGQPRQGLAEGGLIGNVFSSKGPDDTLIWAKRGEYVVNPDSSRRFHSVLTSINAGHFPRHYANGGVVNQTTLGDVTIHVDGSSSPSTTARAVMKELKREKRRGNGGF